MRYVAATVEGLLSGTQLLVVGFPLILFGAVAAYLAGLRSRLLILAVAVMTAVGLLVVTSELLGLLPLRVPLPLVATASLLPPLVAQSTVSATWAQKLVTADDISLYRDVGKRLRADELVLNDWLDGSTWMYAYADARPVIPYDFSETPESARVFSRLRALGPSDCQWLLDAVRRL